jgi:hypothetical protein
MDVCSKMDLLFLGALQLSKNTTRFTLFQFAANYEKLNLQKYDECYLNGEYAHLLTLFRQIKPPTDSTAKKSDGFFLESVHTEYFKIYFAFIDSSNVKKCSCCLRNVCQSFLFAVANL